MGAGGLLALAGLIVGGVAMGTQSEIDSYGTRATEDSSIQDLHDRRRCRFR